MKIKLQILLITFLLFSFKSIAQTVYYKVGKKEILTADQYTNKVQQLSKQGKVHELLLRTHVTQDSIIKLTRLSVQHNAREFDSYAASKMQINKKFPIQYFLNSDKKNFERTHLEGKPTVINFWFTQCPPCIAEIPLLNQFVDKFGDEVNFITISFDDKGKIERFLREQDFKFEHIANSRKQIIDLNISAYPTTLILDKNAVTKFAFPDIAIFAPDINIILDGML